METEDDDIYIPELPKYYKFKGKELLKDNYKKQVQLYNKVNIFAYEVRTNGKNPFMQILLSKSIVRSKLVFPHVPVLLSIQNTKDLIGYVKTCLFGILNEQNFESFDSLTIFDGFYETDSNELYLFFEITKIKLQLNDIYLNSSLRFALIDEIMHHRNICNIPICSSVTDLFTSSSKDYCYELCFLVDENGDSYDTPVVGFVNKDGNYLQYNYVFGEPKGDKSQMFGPYFYFNNFNKAFECAGSRDCKSGIVRYALILSRTKYIENFPDDPPDMSEIKVVKLLDENGNPAKERLTMRITDYDGKWAEKYDSVFFGKVELDDGQLMNECITVVKEYEQQIPLSFHYINKKTLDSGSDNYSIL
jgi:hypothetical protein